MNVLPVLLDFSPSTKPDLSAPGGGPSVDGFARILDSALSRPTTSAPPATPPPLHPSGPYESPTKPLAAREPAAARPAREEGGGQYKAAESPTSADRAEKRDATSQAGGSPGKTERSDRHVKDKRGTADSSAKNPESKAAASKRDAANAAAQKAAQDKRTAGGKKTDKGPHDQKAAVVKAKATPFPGAILLAGTKKEVQTALEAAAERAAKSSGRGAKGHGVAPARVDAKGVAVAEAPGGKQGAKEAAENKLHANGKKSKATHDSGAKNVQIAAQLQPGPGFVAASGGSLQPSAAANAAPQAPGGHGDHPTAATPPQNPAGGAPALTVIDLRHGAQNGGTTADSRGGQSQNGGSPTLRLFQLADGGMNSTSSTGGQASARPVGAPLAGQGFSALTDHIVKQTGILLKDNNSGEIRLVLKPENLGQLRIKIDMVNNNLTGRIFVQNHDALRLVQQNLDGLYRALRESGFTASQLNVSVGGREESHEREKPRSSPLPLLRAVEGVKGFDSQMPAMEAMGGAPALVNLVI